MFAYLIVMALAEQAAAPAKPPQVTEITLGAPSAPPEPGEKPKITSIVLLAPGEGAPPMPLIPEGPEPKGEHKPRANLMALFSTDDYPAEALQKEETGTVVVKLGVSPAGAVTGCQVIESSKSASLDQVTCDILMKRAKFQPARNAKGKRVADTYVQRVRWALPERGAMPVMEMRNRTTLAFGADGALTACKNSPQLPTGADKARCDMMLGIAKMWLGGGTISNRTLVMEDGMLLSGPDALRAIGSNPGDALISRNGVQITIAQDGKVTGCQHLDGATGQEADPVCVEIRKQSFAPSTSAAPRTVVSFTAMYFQGGA